MNNIELLAPAGNLEKLKIALAFGADAVYCGIPDFSLRVRINNFDLPKLKQGIEQAHALGKKVYITTNIFAHNKHLKNLDKYLTSLKKLKPDAFIVSDPGIIMRIKEIWPEAEIHLSTQANCTNWQSAKFWSEQGVKRIILGREVTIAEIKDIHARVPEVELEYFVHGAMCMSYSGRCLLSKFFMDRSANLGDCTQPCRWQYNTYLEEVKRPGEFLEIEEDLSGSYIMNSKDLCLLEYLDQLIDAGVSSFKIEGRAKSVYYVGNIVKVYREVIDKIKKKEKIDYQYYLHELNKSQNRGFTSGFAISRDECEQNTEKSHEPCAWEFCGIVVQDVEDENLTTVKVHNQLLVGDQLEFVSPGEEIFSFQVEKILDEKMSEITEAHGGQEQIVYLPINRKFSNNTLIRRRLVC